MRDETVLGKIGITDEIVEKWKREGLMITYPVKKNPHWIKSADGEVYVENADKFFPFLTKKETKLYIDSPQKFKEDFLKNVKFCRRFLNYIGSLRKNIEGLNLKKEMSALLSLVYIFGRAIDYHYYHWDRYLAYEDYPNTPVGYWWKKLKDLIRKFSKKESAKDLLNIVALDKNTLKKFKKVLPANDFRELEKTLKSIKIFENAQQREVEIITNFRTKENLFTRTGFPILNRIWELIRKNPDLVKKEKLQEMEKIIGLHPIIAARKLMLTSTLKYFDEEIFLEFEEEVSRWI